jgi:hypothetical protein
MSHTPPCIYSTEFGYSFRSSYVFDGISGLFWRESQKESQGQSQLLLRGFPTGFPKTLNNIYFLSPLVTNRTTFLFSFGCLYLNNLSGNPGFLNISGFLVFRKHCLGNDHIIHHFRDWIRETCLGTRNYGAYRLRGGNRTPPSPSPSPPPPNVPCPCLSKLIISCCSSDSSLLLISNSLYSRVQQCNVSV